MTLKYFFFFLLLLLAYSIKAQTVTNRGKQFYFTYLYHKDGFWDTTKTVLYLAAKQNTTGTVTNPNTGYSASFSISAGTVTAMEIPKPEGLCDFPDGIENKGLIITTSDTIAAYANNSQKYSSDAMTLLQTDALGTQYLVATYTGKYFEYFPDNVYYYSEFSIVATEDNTSIDITPAATTSGGKPAGVTFNITLNRGQVYSVKALEDLSGSMVKVTNGCKKIAVFSGNSECGIPITDKHQSTDHLCEQLFPVSTFGKRFITTMVKGQGVYFARVYAAYDNTTVSLDGTAVATINAGQFYEFESRNIPKYITTSNPAEVMLFMASTVYDYQFSGSFDSDPAMISIPPIEQQVTDCIFISLTDGVITKHNVNIICKTADIAQSKLDGVSIPVNSFKVIPGNPLYSFAVLDISAGHHRMENAAGFIAFSTGLGYYQSYGYCTGTSLNRINTYFTCNGVPSLGSPTIDVCRGPAVFDIITSDANTSYTWDFGDGSPTVTTPGNVLQQTHNYTTDGNYVVTLTSNNTVTNVCEVNSNSSISQLKLHVSSSLVPTVALTVSPAGAVCSGTPVSIVATATNAGTNPVYLWTRNGVSVGGNTPVYTDSIFNNNDVISCTVLNTLPCANSNSASASTTLQVNNSVSPTVSIAAFSSTVCSNTPVTFTATANTGAGTFYQWTVNGVNQGTNSTSFTYTPVDKDRITCKISVAGNCFKDTVAISNEISITVNAATNSPSITVAASQNNICAGTNISFTATAVNGGTAPIYQWQVNGVNAGTNSSSFSSTTLQNGDKISCTLTSNQACLTNTTATSQAVTMQVNPLVTPTISIAANKIEICRNDDVTISATVTNAGASPQYQWKVNGNTVPGNSATFSSPSFNNGDQVTCTLTSNAACAVSPALSNAISIKVNPLVSATVSIAAAPNRICKGEQMQFTASAVNAGASPIYQWLVNGVPSGNNSSNFSSTTLNNGDKISCNMTSSLGCTSKAGSNEVVAQVDSLPTVVFNPSERLIFYGDAIQLTPGITGTIATYLWTPADNLSNTTTASVLANPVENKTYQLSVTSVDGCKANASVTVKVFRDLLMPNAFTPNGDGKNDVFRIPPGLNIGITHFIIFNRFGEKVFETSDSNKAWDGKVKGKIANVGAYTWIIEYFNPFENKNVSRKGTVMLVR